MLIVIKSNYIIVKRLNNENKKIKLIAPKGEHGRQSISFYDKDNNFISVYHYYYQSNKGETTAPSAT